MEESDKRVEVRALHSNPKGEAFWAFYDLAVDATELLHATLNEVIPIQQTGGAAHAIHQWSIYLGTLAEENAAAASELLMLDMPRAASQLVRQLYEYRIKLDYLVRHENKALSLMNSLEKYVSKEANNAGDYFDADLREAYGKNYREWALANPQIEAESSEAKFKEMVRDAKGDGFEADYFLYYSYPSIIAHGKPHGIIDVLSAEDGGRVKKHFWNSRTLDWMTLFSRTIAFVVELTAVLRVRFGLELAPVIAVNAKHGTLQERYG